MDTATEDVDLSPISQLAKDLKDVLHQIETAERSALVRDLAAIDQERFGVLSAALSDAQDEGAPGTVAGVLAVLDAALGGCDTRRRGRAAVPSREPGPGDEVLSRGALGRRRGSHQITDDSLTPD